MYKIVEPVINYDVIDLCQRSYHNHSKGCPNYAKKEGCPPFVKYFDDVYDLKQPVYAIYNRFDLSSHVQKLKIKHPRWTDYQLKCCLYWQPTARKQLVQEIKKFNEKYPDYIVERVPEGMGVNITETMKKIGIILEWPPQNYTYQIALACKLK